MDSNSKTDMNQYYSGLLKERGSGISALNYKTEDQQIYRFGLLTAIEAMPSQSSVLDVGCGLGHLCDYLKAHGWQGSYTGVDINPDMVAAGQERLPKDTLVCADILDGNFTGEFDYVFCGATVQHKPKFGDPVAYLEQMVEAMFRMTRNGLAFDVFSNRVDFEDPITLYVEPEHLLKFCYSLSSRLAFKNDFRPYEIMVYLYKNADQDDLHIFKEWSPSSPKII